MYYIAYGFLYLLSLLPFFILYLLSDLIYILIYYVSGYRKAIVFANLAIAFPEKTVAERKKIARQFYRNFIDTFIETIKVLSMSNAAFDKRCVGNFEVINAVAAKGKNIQVMGGHMFNWEYANLVLGRQIRIPFIGVYGAIKNKSFERLFLKLRAKYGTILVSTSDFRTQMAKLTGKQYSMYLLADQNPSQTNIYWMNFFTKPAPFIASPHKTAVKTNTAIIFVNFRKIKRGYYSFDSERVIEDPANYPPEDLARQYRDFIEDIVRRQPENYLWSHRRWRYDYVEADSKQYWIDG